MIHCIGDSHVSVFTGVDAVKENCDALPFFRTYWLGPRTAYNIAKKAGAIRGIIEEHVKDGDAVLFCFGEIDCRTHLVRQSELQGRPLFDVTRDCVENYVKVLESAGRYGRRIIVWNVPPSSFGSWSYGGYPTYGSCEQRNEATVIFNGLLKEYCERTGRTYVSIYDRLLDKEGLPDPIFFMDNIHLSQKVMPFILEELAKAGVLKEDAAAAGPDRGYGGHLTEKKELRLKHVKTGGSIRPDFLKELQLISNAECFVETGTYLGDTSDAAARIFKEVHTVELSRELYEKAIRRFQGKANVHLYQGDSVGALPGIIRQIRGRAVIWLDAHYSKGATEKAGKNTPIIEELKVIRDLHCRDAVLLIDDVINFQHVANDRQEYSSLTGYPSLQEVCGIIREIGESYDFAVMGNILLAYPEDSGISLSPVLRSCTASRLFDDSASSGVDMVLEAEEMIASAEGEELSAIRRFQEDSLAMENYGLGGHYRLWHGLTLSTEKRSDEACNELAMAMRLGCGHWRVRWYMARSAYNGGNYRLARESLGPVLSSSPGFQEAEQMRKDLAEKLQGDAPDGTLSAKSYLALANQLQNDGRYAEAIHAIETAISLGADDADTGYQFAQLFIVTGQLQRAEAELKKVVQMHPRHTYAYNDLGVISFQRGDYPEAVKYYRSAVTALNQNYTALRNLLALLISLGSYNEAVSITQALMRHMPYDKELRALAGEFSLPDLPGEGRGIRTGMI